MQKPIRNSSSPRLSASEAFRLGILSSIKNSKERVAMAKRLEEARQDALKQHNVDMEHEAKVRKMKYENL